MTHTILSCMCFSIFTQPSIALTLISQSTFLYQRIQFGHVSYFHLAVNIELDYQMYDQIYSFCSYNYFMAFFYAYKLYFPRRLTTKPLKLLISQSKFSGTRKFTLRYQQFRLNFEILTVEACNVRVEINSTLKVTNM